MEKINWQYEIKNRIEIQNKERIISENFKYVREIILGKIDNRKDISLNLQCDGVTVQVVSKNISFYFSFNANKNTPYMFFDILLHNTIDIAKDYK